MSKTIAVCNKKGGVAKTTSAVNLAAALVREKKNVLVLDLDPQHDATKILQIKDKPLKQCQCQSKNVGKRRRNFACF